MRWPGLVFSWLETHFVLLAKIIEYLIIQLNLSHWFALIQTVQTVFLWFSEKIRFPTNTIYAIHSKLLQINDWSFN